MSDPQQIERDLRDYLEKEPNLNRADRLVYLKTIFNKHLEVDKLDHQVTYGDFFLILSDAKRHFTNMQVPVKLTKKQIEPNELQHIAFMESFTLYLHKKDLLKKRIGLDYTE